MLPPTEQGFTGHRQMDALGIVHMKGRIYDPTLGRFLQAAPFVQEPKNSQNYNRYSYVLNNPMSYTDPSGYFFKALGKFANGAVTGAFSRLLNDDATDSRKATIEAKWKKMVGEFNDSIEEAYQMGQDGDIDGYIKKVGTNGDWDFKNRAEYRNLAGIEEFGNYAFGATSQAWADGYTGGISVKFSDISIDLAMRGAGYYQQHYQSKNHKASDGTAFDYNDYPGSTNYGDNWRDQAHVWMGAKHYYRLKGQGKIVNVF